MKRHLIFVGLPGSGKSTVGKAVAKELGAEFVDLDKVVERKAGMPVDRLFAEAGEAAFRKMESEAMAALLQGDPRVSAPGGGWAAQPGEMERAKQHAFVVYLKSTITAAVERSSALPEGRPILMSNDPFDKMRELLEARQPFYDMAHAEIDNTKRPISEVVAESVTLARTHAGW